jgi:hypothetical protein
VFVFVIALVMMYLLHQTICVIWREGEKEEP